MKRRSDGVPFRTIETNTLPELLREVYMSEDYGDGYIKIHNTCIDDDIYIEIVPVRFWESNKVRDLIHKFCKDLADLAETDEKLIRKLKRKNKH